FAIERAQELLYVLYEAWRAGRIPKSAKIFLDSPMAISVTRVFADLPRYYDEEILEMAEQGGNPFNYEALICTSDTRESMRINDRRAGSIILAGSGMVTGGRVLHHLKHNIMRPECGVIFCGFQAENTLGRRIVEGEPEVKIMGQYYPVNAEIWTINGFSAHGGQDEMTDWARSTRAERLYLVHGEEDAKDTFQEHLEAEMPDTEVGQMQFGEAVEL
ncbi:MAG: MBL fold metallo-hydrolase RNA specificity domain-containing protein, partial [Myxococcota bacterium]